MINSNKHESPQTRVEQNYLDGLLGIDDDGSIRSDPREIEVVQLSNHCDEAVINEQMEPEESVPTQALDPVEKELVVVNDTESEYQVLSVGGLNLALVSDTISSIIPWPKKVWPDADKHNWVIGLIAYKDTAIDLVSLAALINPAATAGLALEKIDGETKTIVILKNEKTGLICDGLGEKVMIDAEEICRRSSGSQRKWLAGTVKKKSLAILDATGIEKILKDEDRTE